MRHFLRLLLLPAAIACSSSTSPGTSTCPAGAVLRPPGFTDAYYGCYSAAQQVLVLQGVRTWYWTSGQTRVGAGYFTHAQSDQGDVVVLFDTTSTNSPIAASWRAQLTGLSLNVSAVSGPSAYTFTRVR